MCIRQNFKVNQRYLTVAMKNDHSSDTFIYMPRLYPYFTVSKHYLETVEVVEIQTQLWHAYKSDCLSKSRVYNSIMA